MAICSDLDKSGMNKKLKNTKPGHMFCWDQLMEKLFRLKEMEIKSRSCQTVPFFNVNANLWFIEQCFGDFNYESKQRLKTSRTKLAVWCLCYLPRVFLFEEVVINQSIIKWGYKHFLFSPSYFCPIQLLRIKF